MEYFVDPRLISFDPRADLSVDLAVVVIHQKRVLIRNVVLHSRQHLRAPV